jgi:hypothetical protein
MILDPSNCAYKIISKVLVIRLKKLFGCIYPKQFGFLEGRCMHEEIGSRQEDMYSIRVKKLSSMVLKLDMPKAYDRTYWIYLRLLLIHIGFGLSVVNWIIGCVFSVSYDALINGFASPFFNPSRGL